MKLLKYLDFILEAKEEITLPSIFMRDFINQIEKNQQKVYYHEAPFGANLTCSKDKQVDFISTK